MSKPIALFIYKRASDLSKILEVIETYHPSELLVFADGPKNSREVALCKKARAVIDGRKFAFPLTKFYFESNKGLSGNILGGIAEVFKRHDSAIFIEDDCIPSKTFFHFCDYGLNQFKEDDEVFQIGASQWLPNEFKGPLKSRFSLPAWGWASWKEKWEYFDPSFNTYKENRINLSRHISKKNYSIWKRACNSLSIGNRDSWDLQWQLDIWSNKGYSILPPKNLVSNIGFLESASYNPLLDKFSFEAYEFDISKLHSIRKASLDEEINLENSLTELISHFIDHNQSKFAISKQVIKNETTYQKGLSPKSIEDLKLKIKQLPEATFFGELFFREVLSYLKNKKLLFSSNWLQIGAWKGGSSVILAAIRRDANANGKLFIIDTFGTIPIKNLTKTKDLEFVSSFNIGINIKDYLKEVKKRFQNYDFDESCFEAVQGNICDMKNNKVFEKKFSLIFIDVDFFEPTYASLENAYHCLDKKGVIIIDDYYSPIFNCKEAVDLFFKSNGYQNEVTFHKLTEHALLIEKLN